ncbi:hypothetical protein DD570_24060 [Klebsiella pneumoniae]|nr:hotdog fold thioesterase [Klebsiella pneumoniae]RXY71790.1 hypothetical protein DD570_24060 [Klebsiella pneumoniae]
MILRTPIVSESYSPDESPESDAKMPGNMLGYVGTELNASHHRAVSSGKVRGECRPLHLGRQSQSWEIVVYDEKGRRCCTCRLGTAVLG